MDRPTEYTRNRAPQILLIAATLAGSWLLMQAVHEFGHVLGALTTGGRVSRVVLNPLTISRTGVSPNPHPLAVAWAGPTIGVTLPLAVWWGAANLRIAGSFVLRFFAGFCSIANGSYIAGGSFERIGDCGVLLAHGASAWQLWLFGAATVPMGLWLWHGQGPHFGIGRDVQPVDARLSYAVLAAVAVIVAVELLISPE